MAKTRGISHSSDATALDPAAGHHLWDTLKKTLFDRYRPELHYMRGPGPKWHEKHDQAESPWSPGAGKYSTAH
ncbi:MAG: hypothetical protein ACREDO_04245 [Methyloceanibacter sp.]